MKLICCRYENQQNCFLVRNIAIITQIIAQRAFDEYRGAEMLPGGQCLTDAQLEQYMRSAMETVYHPTSTCRMGSPNSGDDKVVVDSNCAVVGVEGLRVVDASVMPSVVSGNTNAPTIMIAEKASDIILGKPALPKANIVNKKAIK